MHMTASCLYCPALRLTSICCIVIVISIIIIFIVMIILKWFAGMT